MDNNPMVDDDDIIILSSDDDGNGATPPPSSSTLSGKKQTSSPASNVRPNVKVEKDVENQQRGINTNGGGTTTADVQQSQRESPAKVNINSQQGMPSGFSFDAFALFGPENASMPIEERLASFINNVQSLTEEKIKLENAERQAKRQCEEATTQLTSANQEISKLKENLVQSQSKISHQNSSISDLQNAVDRLKKQENGSKTKLKSITGTLMNLQAKMVRILEETEMDSSSSSTALANTGSFDQSVPTAVKRSEAFTASADSGGGSIGVADVMLKENIETFEKDFEMKFSQIEEQDREIKNELQRTNEMLQRIQLSLMEQFQTESSASSSPQLTHESMDDQEDMDDEQIPSSSTSSCTGSGGSYNGMTRKLQR